MWDWILSPWMDPSTIPFSLNEEAAMNSESRLVSNAPTVTISKETNWLRCHNSGWGSRLSLRCFPERSNHPGKKRFQLLPSPEVVAIISSDNTQEGPSCICYRRCYLLWETSGASHIQRLFNTHNECSARLERPRDLFCQNKWLWLVLYKDSFGQ